MPLDFSKTEPNYQILADSIRRAEGGNKARVPYGILSIPVKNESEARQVAVNTARNNYQRWQEAGMPGSYIGFLANRYTPSADDPQGNKNWKKNVTVIYEQLAKENVSKPSPKVVPPPKPLSIFEEPLPYVTPFPKYPIP